MGTLSLRWSLALFLPLAFFMSGSASFPNSTAATRQNKNRIVRRLPLEPNRPISIADVTVRGSKVHPGRGFLDSDDWLEGLVVKIRNRSEKEIVFASIDLQFPRSAGSEFPFAIDEITFGNRELVSRLPISADSSDRIAPKQTLDFRLSAGQVNDIKSLLTATGYRSEGPEEVRIRIGTVIFSDGTMWRVGTRLRRKSAGEPSKWVVEEDQLMARREIPLPSGRNRRSFAFLSAGFSTSKVLQPVPFNVQTSCKAFDSTTSRPCMDDATCTVLYDWVSHSASGNYYGASAYSLCKRSGQSCNVYQSVIVANLCSGGSGGGGGGGGLGGNDDPCYSDFDCDWGSSCGDSGVCEVEWLY